MWPEPEETLALLDQAVHGDPRAVERLFERHRPALCRLVALRLDHLIRRRVDQSDVVQEVLLEAHRRLADYLHQPQLPFHLWLRQIAQDRLIDAYRRHRGAARRSVDREHHPASAPPDDRSALDLAAQLADHQPTPATAATRRELARRFDQALARLDDADREVLTMRHLEQLTNQEVAQVLGLSEPAAGMRYLRALRRLRPLLEETAGDDA